MRILFLLTVLLLSAWCGAQNFAVVYDGSQETVTIGRQIGILEDKTGKLTLANVTSAGTFKQSEIENPNLGVSRSTFWIRFTVSNTSGEAHLLLTLASPLTDEATLYTTNEEGTFSEQKISEACPFSQRKYSSLNYVFDLDVPNGATRAFYLKIKSSEQIQLPLTISTPKAVFESDATSDLISGLYFGTILIMFFYNLFIYFTVKDKSYLYYVAYILLVGLTQASLHGYGSKFLWPHSPWLIFHSIFLVPCLTGLAAIGFVNNFLQVKLYAPALRKISFVIGSVYVIAIILGVTGKYDISYNIIDFNALLLSIYMLWVAIKIVRKGYRPAKFFLLAWSFFLAAVFIFVAKSKGALPYNNLTNSILEIGSAIEVMLLSFALADRINILQKEKEESQRRALHAVRENERIVSEQNVILEAKVKERTEELETSNRNLKDAQVQLVNAEKMASLGQLTAGIAHEINNPINFVISNVNPLKRDITDLLQVLDRYAGIRDEKELAAKLGEIQELKKQLDTDYVIKEIDLLLRGIEEGASRTSEIVRGLQNFSRLDEEGAKMANIHAGIDATLLLLNSALNGKKIHVVREYGNFGDVECYPGKLNQVFMNILNNAMQAFPDDASNKEIRIQTQKTSNSVIIKIKDNAGGMPEEVRRRIFEPFFTTKGVGEGSGLGLSIVYGIIEKHKGKIDVESELGKGTEFIITLPLNVE